MMNNLFSYEDKISFAQVYDIINFLNEEEKKKIPQNFIFFLKNNKAENYISTVNPYIPLEMQKISKEAKAIISYIYYFYLAEKNEKNKFKEKALIEKQKTDEKYWNLFKTENNTSKINTMNTIIDTPKLNITDNKIAIVKRKNIFKKFLDQLRKLLKI